jgi:hypothetical protein
LTSFNLFKPKRHSEKIKEKTHKFISNISVYGISRIIKADTLAVKLLWATMILMSVSAGLYIIYRSVRGFYSYNVITNVERIVSRNQVFPAATICARHEVKKQYRSKYVTVSNFSVLNFLDLSESEFAGIALNASDFEAFRIPHTWGNCVRFNNSKLATVKKSTERLFFKINTRLRSTLPNNDFEEYTLSSDFEVYVADNYLNSFWNLFPLRVKSRYRNRINIYKTEYEKKLGEPFSDCDEFLEPTYRQANCIEICTSREIRGEHNCSIPSYYTTEGSRDR